MWKMVMGEYFKSFTWGNIKENGIYRVFSFFMVYLWFQPIIYGVFGDEKWGTKEFVVWFAVILPIVLGNLGTACYTAGLNKLMYLCPMSAEERKEYMNTKCMVKIAVPAIVSLLGGIVYVCMDGYPLYALAMVCNHCALYICAACDTNIYGWGTRDDKGNYVMDSDTKRGWLELCIRIVVYIMAVVHASVLPGEGSLATSLWMLGIAMAVELPMVIWFVKHWPEYVEYELHYETTERVWNGKGPVKK